VPFLLVIFLLIEIFEHRLGGRLVTKIKSARAWGPIIGALAGIIPQCGFSVIGVALFAEGYITIGSLVAIFIATSDEALPIMLSSPDYASQVGLFIITKFLFAIFWGYLLDLIFYKFKWNLSLKEEEDHHHGCCGTECVNQKAKFTDLLFHALRRTGLIFIYLTVITFLFNWLLSTQEVAAIVGGPGSNELIKIIIASFVGLIPNCATSVGLIEAYIKAAISFPAVMAGLSTNAGLALLVLFKEARQKKIALAVTGLLLLCGIMTGVILFLPRVW